MTTWYERAENQIEQDFEDGLIDGKEYQAQMRDLHAEFREHAQERADHAFNDAMGGIQS